MARLNRAVTCLLVAVAMLTSAWTACAEGASTPASQQMACCTAGHDHCPMKDGASDCCRQSGSQSSPQAALIKGSSVNAPAVATTWVILPPRPLAGTALRHVSYDSSPPDLLSAPPPYIAFSSLLI